MGGNLDACGHFFGHLLELSLSLISLILLILLGCFLLLSLFLLLLLYPSDLFIDHPLKLLGLTLLLEILICRHLLFWTIGHLRSIILYILLLRLCSRLLSLLVPGLLVLNLPSMLLFSLLLLPLSLGLFLFSPLLGLLCLLKFLFVLLLCLTVNEPAFDPSYSLPEESLLLELGQ